MGNIPVAISTTDEFDVIDVNPDAVVFLAATPCKKEQLEDVDGDIDMLFHFKIKECDFSLLVDEGGEYPYAYLTGETINGISFEGKDTINLVPFGQKSKTINRPILQFLQNLLNNYPNLFPILQRLLLLRL